jgi:hypothetical protein
VLLLLGLVLLVVWEYARWAAVVTGVDDRDPEAGARRLLDWLAATSARWLIVLDDLQAPQDLCLAVRRFRARGGIAPHWMVTAGLVRAPSKARCYPKEDNGDVVSRLGAIEEGASARLIGSSTDSGASFSIGVFLAFFARSARRVDPSNCCGRQLKSRRPTWS